MTVNGALSLLFFLGFSGCTFLSMVLHYEMVEAINKLRRGEKPIQFLGFVPRPMGSWKVFSLYRTWYPDGDLLGRYWLVVGAQGICFAMMVLFLVRAAKH